MGLDNHPEFVGPYRILDLLGEGGMGLVYRAQQEEPVCRRVALKVLKAGMDTREVLARFEAERRMLALMDHPNIARALDAGETVRGRPYFVMELIKGEPITAYCDRANLSLHDRLSLFVPVCRAIQHAHHKGVIHRDLKPSNILVTPVDGDPVAKVIDFGIAKATGLSVSERTLFTRHGAMLGTPEYMSPEQAENDGLDVDTRTDVYSLGVVLYELLTGATPFDGGSLRRAGCAEIQRVLRDEEPMRPSAKVASLSGTLGSQTARRAADTRSLARRLQNDLDWIVLKALSKDRTRRYETADALAEDIGRYLRDEPVMAGPPSTIYRLRKLARRNRAALAMTGVVVVGILATSSALALALLQANRHAQRVEAALNAFEVANSVVADVLSAVDPLKEGRRVTETMLEDLDRSAEAIERSFADQPMTMAEASLRFNLGRLYAALGLYDRAEPHLERALLLSTQLRGETSDDALKAHSKLADLYRAAGRFDEAREQYQAVLDTTRRVLGEDHPGTLPVLNSLTSLHATAAHPYRPADREVMARRALEIGMRYLGEEHPDTLDAMHNYAEILGGLQPLEATALYERAIDVSRKIHGDGHPQTIRLMHALGFHHYALQHYDQAESYFQRALENAPGPADDSYPDTLEIVADLGMTYKAQGRYEEAERRYLDALNSARRDLGPDHPSTLSLMNNLGQLYRRQGRLDEAIRALEPAFEANRRLHGEMHEWTMIPMRNLGRAYQQKGLYEDAEGLLTRVVAVSRQLYGNEHFYTRDSLTMLASVYHDRGRYEDEKSILNQVSASNR